MLDRHDVGRFQQRSHSAGPEILGDRPWVALSDADIHQFDVAIVAAVTEYHAVTQSHEHRLEVKTSPPMKKRSDVDLRHLWTFPFVRECTAQEGDRVRKVVRLGVKRREYILVNIH
jgi:mRNA-degrading endonuclease toxin of MazEF toxin-antitoxin module